MQTCPECGNHDMQLRRSDAGPVYECGLCGARFGDRQALTDLDSRDEAAQRGIDAEVFPLARVLETLPGLALGATSAGGRDALPFVELVVTGPDAMAQLENLAKSLRLVAGRLRCRWRIVVQFEHALQLVVGAEPGSGSLRDAWIDTDVLATSVDGNRRLGWWLHAKVDENG